MKTIILIISFLALLSAAVDETVYPIPDTNQPPLVVTQPSPSSFIISTDGYARNGSLITFGYNLLTKEYIASIDTGLITHDDPKSYPRSNSTEWILINGRTPKFSETWEYGRKRAEQNATLGLLAMWPLDPNTGGPQQEGDGSAAKWILVDLDTLRPFSGSGCFFYFESTVKTNCPVLLPDTPHINSKKVQAACFGGKNYTNCSVEL